MENATKSFVAAWVNDFLGKAGIIGQWQSEDFELGHLRWLDKRESLNDLQIALTALRSDWNARKGHRLAGQLLNEIDEILSAEPERKFFRRPLRKANRERELAAA